ncbi:MAG TPA: RDD family protein [Nitrosopumilaceae archaeon]|nr:RDD family protein [Nitrosopumilaceae archaeon]
MSSEQPKQIVIAKWKDRFLAWLIDSVIITTAVSIPFMLTRDAFGNPAWYCSTGIVIFGYWVIMEYRYGQSVGKRALNIKTTRMDGQAIDLKDNMIHNFGKAFLLPIDLIIGWILNDKKQRLFNRLSQTIVIKLEKSQESNISYKMD